VEKAFDRVVTFTYAESKNRPGNDMDLGQAKRK